MSTLLRDALVAALQRGATEPETFDFRLEHWRDPTALWPSALLDRGAQRASPPSLFERLRHRSPLGMVVAATLGYRAPPVDLPEPWASPMSYEGTMTRGPGDFGATLLRDDTDEAPGLPSTTLGPKDLSSLLYPSWVLAGSELTEEAVAPVGGRTLTFVRAELVGPFQALPPLIRRADSLRIGFDEALRVIIQREAFWRGRLLDRVTVLSLERASSS